MEGIVDFITADLAKNKGFDEPCHYHYTTDGKLENILGKPKKNSYYVNIITAPTQSLLQKWFREKHNIFIDIITDATTEPKFTWEIVYIKNDEWIIPSYQFYLYKTFEEALDEALKEAFKLI